MFFLIINITLNVILNCDYCGKMLLYVLGISIIIILLFYNSIEDDEPEVTVQTETPQKTLIYDAHMEAKRVWCESKNYHYNASTNTCEHTELSCYNNGREVIRSSVEDETNYTAEYTEWSDELGMCIQSNYAYPVHLFCKKYQREAKYQNSFVYSPPTFKCIEEDTNGNCIRVDIDKEPSCTIQPVYCEKEKLVDYDYGNKDCNVSSGQFILESVAGTTNYRIFKKRIQECKHIDCVLWVHQFIASFVGLGVEGYWVPASKKWVTDVKADCGGAGTFARCSEEKCGDKKMTKKEYDKCIKTECMGVSSGSKLGKNHIEKAVSKECINSLLSLPLLPITSTYDMVGSILSLIPHFCSGNEFAKMNPLCSSDNFAKTYGIKMLADITFAILKGGSTVATNLPQGLFEGLFHGDSEKLEITGRALATLGVDVGDAFKDNVTDLIILGVGKAAVNSFASI